ncbi:hypothetical protein CB1_000875002 [Camelus ferus]|nr:hypothetical protein CB1_000875002 [Camelus ferus]
MRQVVVSPPAEQIGGEGQRGSRGWSRRLNNPVRTEPKDTHRAVHAAAAAVRGSLPQAFAQTARDLLAKLHRAPPPDQLRQEVGDARRDQVRATNLGSLTRLPYLLCLPSKYG